MIHRTLHAKLIRSATQYPVVTLTGPRQSGKTTLARAGFPNYAYVSLEDPEQRSFAIEDPRGFLEQFKDNVILDEVQRAPDLFSYIQTIVDAEDRPGRFLLTGSQNFLLLKTISQSLAGRCAIHHLMPFTLGELMAWSEGPPEDFQSSPIRETPPRNLFETLHTGFYPRIHDKGLDAQDWLANYSQTYLERDVRDLVNVGDLEAFRRFMSLCAGRAGQLLNLSSLSADCGITHTTARRWISVLETSFIVLLLRPHHRNFNKRIIKSPKLYFLDTGLLCHLLNIRSSGDLALHPFRGAVFESFVVSEWTKRYMHLGRRPPLYFWRDTSGNEVDVIIETSNSLIPVEIKSGKTVAPDFFKGLHHWRKISGVPEAPGGLIYGGDRSFQQHGFSVRSWWNL